MGSIACTTTPRQDGTITPCEIEFFDKGPDEFGRRSFALRWVQDGKPRGQHFFAVPSDHVEIPGMEAPRKGPLLRQVRNEDLKVGDVISLWCGAKRITAITPYRGSLQDLIFAIATYTPGATLPTGGISLERGGYTDVMA